MLKGGEVNVKEIESIEELLSYLYGIFSRKSEIQILEEDDKEDAIYMTIEELLMNDEDWHDKKTVIRAAARIKKRILRGYGKDNGRLVNIEDIDKEYDGEKEIYKEMIIAQVMEEIDKAATEKEKEMIREMLKRGTNMARVAKYLRVTREAIRTRKKNLEKRLRGIKKILDLLEGL